jgi:formimidoylglutamate deiminase
MTTYVFENLHWKDGWLSPASVQIDADGRILSVSAGRVDPALPQINGLAIPGMPNLHSHAFQRGMVGRAEFRDSTRADSFWTWRKQMYQLAATMTPEDLEAIAAQLYVEMLRSGITAVGEFHYLHHDSNGVPFADLTQMSDRIFAAARSTGIALTHLPVLYVNGGFGQAIGPEQSRFSHPDLDSFLKLYDKLRTQVAGQPNFRLGVAPHSLRAVDGDCLQALISVLEPDTPIHIHIAEQIKEVEEAKEFLGARPVRWLLDHHLVNEKWCLVHATHLDQSEILDLAASGAVAGLCPTTEANLGDGIFPAPSFLQAGGKIGIGTDSQVSVGVNTELRMLEYGQRLRDKQRNVLASRQQASVGRRLLDLTLAGGAQALAQAVGRIAPGLRADIVVLDLEHPRLVEHSLDTALDAWIFGHVESAVKDVMVAGRWEILEGQHRHAAEIFERYKKAVRRLWK